MNYWVNESEENKVIINYKINKAIRKLDKSINKRLIAKAKRLWIQNNKHLNLFNYYYYRYFTDEFELYLIKNPVHFLASSGQK